MASLGFVRRSKYLAGSMGETLARSHRISNSLFKDKSGWSPRYRSVREGFPALVARLGGGSQPGRRSDLATEGAESA